MTTLIHKGKTLEFKTTPILLNGDALATFLKIKKPLIIQGHTVYRAEGGYYLLEDNRLYGQK